HERPRAIYIRDGFGHRLRHVRARVELELHQRRSLNRFRFNVLNPGEVKKVIFEEIDEIPFHLGRVHSAVSLRHINCWKVELRENVSWHLLPRQRGRKPNGNHHHNDGEWPSQSCLGEVHNNAPKAVSSCTELSAKLDNSVATPKDELKAEIESVICGEEDEVALWPLTTQVTLG